VKRNFTQEAAEKAAKSYLSTMSLVSGVQDTYNPSNTELDEDEDPNGWASRSPPTWADTSTPSVPLGRVKLMDGERVVFTEESNPQNYLKLIASGDVDETMLEALEDYVKRQKKRLGVSRRDLTEEARKRGMGE
jgi:hypothetical protein